MRFANIEIDGVDIFYREAGNPGAPKLVLLHGFPSSSHQYRNLIPALAERFHVIAPDYPGFGNSAMPDPAKFDYTFDRCPRSWSVPRQGASPASACTCRTTAGRWASAS